MKYYVRKIIKVRCKKCGWKQKVWNYKVSQLKCSCGGKRKDNWEEERDEFTKIVVEKLEKIKDGNNQK